MSGISIYALGVTVLLLIALAWGAFARAEMHRAKAQVYQEFADTFSAMTPLYRISDKDRRERETKRQWMRMALCDPVVAEGLRSALADADKTWAMQRDRLVGLETPKR